MKKIYMLLLLVFGLTNPALADVWNTDTGGFLSKGTGAVIEGYDPVAYFTQKQAVKGKPEFKASHNRGEFWFTSAENRDLFIKNPAQYAPQYGGYCAYAVAAKNDLVTVDPNAWSVVDGKLYLNYDKDIQATWEKDMKKYLAQSEKNWPKLNQSTSNTTTN
jgi:YHS domain-containing protein